jgi:hypothetical protein
MVARQFIYIYKREKEKERLLITLYVNMHTTKTCDRMKDRDKNNIYDAIR